MLRRLSVVALLILAVCGWAFAADHSSTVSIMTQNMDDGTDLAFIVAAASIPNFPLTVPDAVDLTYGELVATRFDQRNAQLAKQIALRKPDILALQEASLWRTGPTPDNPTIPIVDEIASLMAALNAAGYALRSGRRVHGQRPGAPRKSRSRTAADRSKRVAHSVGFASSGLSPLGRSQPRV